MDCKAKREVILPDKNDESSVELGMDHSNCYVLRIHECREKR